MVAVQEGLAQYVELYLKVNDCTPQQVEALGKWQDKIMDMTRGNLERHYVGCSQDERQQAHMKQAVQRIQEHLVVVPVDKAGHNLAFVCKTWYAQWLRKELTDESGAYRNACESVDDVILQ